MMAQIRQRNCFNRKSGSKPMADSCWKKFWLMHFRYGIYLWLADTSETVRKHLVMSA